MALLKKEGASTVPFDYQPTLRGVRIELRPLRADDFEPLYAVASDPLIWVQHPVRNRHEIPIFRAFFEESLLSGGAVIVRDIQGQRIIGSSRFHGYDEARSEVEIGWTFLARSHWGGSYNTELKRLMLQHAFRFVDAVIFLVGLDNVRSQRAVEKIGAERVSASADTGGRDSYLYRITAATFKGQG
jgi:RimJ/RimL family protein N-acetyltransferase